MSSEPKEEILFNDEEIEKLISAFDSPLKLEQFHYMLKILTDNEIKDEDEINFDEYVNKQKSELPDNDNEISPVEVNN